MLRQIAIILLVPLLITPGIISDGLLPGSSFAFNQITADNSPDPDRGCADLTRPIVQIVLIISFLIFSYFIPRQDLLITSFGSRDPPYSR